MSFGGSGNTFSFGGAGGNNDQANKPAFSFGAPTNATSNAPAGGSQPASGGSTTGFSFGGGGAGAAGQTAGAGTAGNTTPSFSFGPTTTSSAPASGGLFGATTSASGSTTPLSKPAFGGFGTPSNAAQGAASSTTPAVAPPSNLFSGFNKPAAPSAGGSLFGASSSTTPAPGASFSFGPAQGNSQAPASQAASASTPSTATPSAPLFGAPPSASTDSAKTANAPAAGAFTFGKPAAAAPAASSTTPAFGGFGATSNTPAAGQPPTSSAGTTTPAAAATAPSAGFSFGSATPASKPVSGTTTPAAAPGAASGSAGGFSFGGAKPSESTSSTQSKPAGFSFGPPSAATSTANAPSTATAASAAPASTSLFGAKPAAFPTTTPATSSTSATTTAAAAPATVAPAPAGGLFAGFGKSAEAAKPATPAGGTTPAAGGTTVTATSAAPQTSAAVSTNLPVPSLLRGRSMDEIVNKWTQELDAATKEFSRQAAEVAVWDGVLRKGGNEISKLLQALQVAEERQASIEQTLDYVEQQQSELSGLLETYETQVGELLEGSAFSGIAPYGSGKSLRSTLETGAADAERERAYALAESLNAQLDELSRNLSSMIVEVNNLTSSTAANASRHNAEADPASLRVAGRVNQDAGSDPVAQIVSILSAHLGSLKWIDENAAELRNKVENLRRGQIGGSTGARTASSSKRGDLSSASPVVRQRGETVAPGASERQGSLGPDSIRASSVGPGYVRATSVGRNAGTGWSENTVAMGGASNLGRSRGYGL